MVNAIVAAPAGNYTESGLQIPGVLNDTDTIAILHLNSVTAGRGNRLQLYRHQAAADTLGSKTGQANCRFRQN